MNDNKVYYQAIISNMIMQQTTLKNNIQSKSMDPNAIKIGHIVLASSPFFLVQI